MSKFYNEICEKHLEKADCDTCKIRMICYKVDRVILEEENEDEV